MPCMECLAQHHAQLRVAVATWRSVAAVVFVRDSRRGGAPKAKARSNRGAHGQPAHQPRALRRELAAARAAGCNVLMAWVGGAGYRPMTLGRHGAHHKPIAAHPAASDAASTCAPLATEG
jgi:hypothetical protein